MYASISTSTKPLDKDYFNNVNSNVIERGIVITKSNSADPIAKQALCVLISNDDAQEHSGNGMLKNFDTYSIHNDFFLNKVACKPIE